MAGAAGSGTLLPLVRPGGGNGTGAAAMVLIDDFEARSESLERWSSKEAKRESLEARGM